VSLVLILVICRQARVRLLRLRSDYTYILDQCYLTRAPYIGIFEDDIIFADGWLAKTLRALHDIEDQLKARNWLFTPFLH
jgi:hypothetical protein